MNFRKLTKIVNKHLKGKSIEVDELGRLIDKICFEKTIRLTKKQRDMVLFEMANNLIK